MKDTRVRTVSAEALIPSSLLLMIAVMMMMFVGFGTSEPTVLQGNGYNLTFPTANTFCTISLLLPNQTTMKLFHTFVSMIREVQVPNEIVRGNISTLEFTEEVFNKSVLISNVTFNASQNEYNISTFNHSNKYGVYITKVLGNGALINYTIYIVTEDLPVEITRVNQTCSAMNPYLAPNKCSCEAIHTVHKNGIKHSLEVSNWPFAPVLNPNISSIMLYTILFMGKITDDLRNISDMSQMTSFNACDVAKAGFHMGGLAQVPVSLFTSGEIDGSPTHLGFLFRPSRITTDPDIGLTVPVDIMSKSFNKSFYYDPDLFVLLAGSTPQTGSSTEGDGVKGDGTGDTSTRNIIIGVGCRCSWRVVGFVLYCSGSGSCGDLFRQGATGETSYWNNKFIKK